MENPKKPTRDISDLKARLGLTKPGAVPTPAPASAPTSQTPSPASAPMPTPRPPAAGPFPAAAAPFPSAPLPAPTPAPFPAPAAPQPAAPPPPDVREDPFGAMKSGMAPVIIQAPTFDPGPVESVRAADRTKFLRVAGLAALVAVGGFWCGGINGGRKVHNNTIRDAKQIKAEVEVMAKSTQGIIDELNKSAQRAGNKPDFELIEKLETLKIEPPNTQKIFRTNYAYLDDLAVDMLFNYYNDTIQLQRAIEQHVKRTKQDKEQLEMVARATGTDQNYGVVFDGSGAITVAKLVELGKILCKGGAADCKARDLEGFEFRMSPTSSWTSRAVKGPDSNRVVPIDRTELWANVTAGKPELLVKRAYELRLGQIRMLAQGLFAMQKDLIAKLDAASKKSTLVAL